MLSAIGCFPNWWITRLAWATAYVQDVRIAGVDGYVHKVRQGQVARDVCPCFTQIVAAVNPAFMGGGKQGMGISFDRA